MCCGLLVFPLQDGWTPLHRAAESGDVDAVKQVIGAHIEVSHRLLKYVWAWFYDDLIAITVQFSFMLVLLKTGTELYMEAVGCVGYSLGAEMGD